MRIPTWAEVEAFLRADRWEEVRETDHARHLTEEEIRTLSPEEVVRLAQELWSQPPDPG